MAKKKQPEILETKIGEITLVEVSDREEDVQEDSYLSQSELEPNARWVSELLNDILYKVHRDKYTTNEINKLRAQLENNVSIR